MKYFLTFLALTTLSLKSFGRLELAPPNFTHQGENAVFIDFKSARYEITYDLLTKTALVESHIIFESKKEGQPLFDLVEDPIEVSLDDSVIETEAIKDPDLQTTLRVVKKKTPPGTHALKIKHRLTKNIQFNESGVSSGFWMSDLNDRRYLEQYLPSNLEFDQYQMNSSVKIINAEGIPHILKTNGKVTVIDENHFNVTYPSFYSASSMYFHLLPEKNNTTNVQFYYSSIDGRQIPVDIYTTLNTDEFVTQTKIILDELEADYGPFPHEQLIIYGNVLSGGMEYSGATATSLKALGHELFHSYHARGLMPANGNAGWMDEAIARWRDNQYPLLQKLGFESTRLAGRSVWTRMTDRMAYTEGSDFLSWIAYRMNEKGLSFKTFLRDYFENYKYTSVTTPLFQKELTEASGLNLSVDFDKYIYGKNTLNKLMSVRQLEDEFHKEYSPSELMKLTNP